MTFVFGAQYFYFFTSLIKL